MRILFTAGPLRGHLQSLLPLLRAASAAGHQVLVATGPDLVGELQRRGYQTWSIGPAARETWAELRSRP
jgi:UDP:flavonoid glycosyltransferase YjiC (YdhE family)